MLNKVIKAYLFVTNNRFFYIIPKLTKERNRIEAL